MATNDDSAFTILGQVRVDNDALRRDLDKSENLVREAGQRLQRVWAQGVTPQRAEGAEADNPAFARFGAPAAEGRIMVGGRSVRADASVFSNAGQAALRAAELAERTRIDAIRRVRREGRESLDRDEGQGGLFGRLTHGAEDAGHKFSHLARITREILAGPLVGLSPEFARVANAMSYASRSATALGAGAGAAVVAMVGLSEVVGAFIRKAQEANQVTLDISQALATLDSGRAEAGFKKIGESAATFLMNMRQLSGEIEAGFWQKIIAAANVATESVTGSIEEQIQQLRRYAAVSEYVADQVARPKAEAKDREVEAQVLARQAEAAKRAALNETQLADAYSEARRAAVNLAKAQEDQIRVEERRQVAAAEAPFKAASGAILKRAADQTRGVENTAAGRAILQRAYQEAEEQLKLGAEAAARVVEENKHAIDRIGKNLDQTLRESAQKEREAMAALEVSREEFFQKDVARQKQRVQGAYQSAQAVADAENQILDARRKDLGLVESSESLEKRLSDTRTRALEPLRAALEAADATYESQKRALQAQIQAGTAGADAQEKLTELEKDHADQVLGIRRDLQTKTAELEARAYAERQARLKAEVDAEDKALQHRVTMGQASLQEQILRAQQATVDPRRSLEQQRAGEEQLLALRKQYADDYFKYYASLGQSTWAEQLSSAEAFLSKTVEGSHAWFEAVQKVADVYKSIQDQARGIFQQQVGIAEQEARRQGRGRIAVGDVGQLVNQVRERDARALSGARVPIGELSAALGRREMFRTMDREGLSPGEAFRRMMQSPQDQLADSLKRASTAVEESSKAGKAAMSTLSDGATSAASALRELADAAAAATRGLPGSGSSTPAAGLDPGLLATAMSDPNVSIPLLDSAMGRQLQLGSRRGPITAEVVQ